MVHGLGVLWMCVSASRGTSQQIAWWRRAELGHGLLVASTSYQVWHVPRGSLLLHGVVFGAKVFDEFSESKGVSFVGTDDVNVRVGNNLVFHTQTPVTGVYE